MAALPSAPTKSIRAEIEDTNSDYEKEKLNERLARLAEGNEPIEGVGVLIHP